MSWYLRQRQWSLDVAIAEHDRLARQAGRPWYDLAKVLDAADKVREARHWLHPLTLAGAGAAHELEYFGGQR